MRMGLLSVDVFSMAHLHNHHHKHIVVNLVNDPINPDPDSLKLRSRQLS